jgi:hypothetical protein
MRHICVRERETCKKLLIVESLLKVVVVWRGRGRSSREVINVERERKSTLLSLSLLLLELINKI